MMILIAVLCIIVIYCSINAARYLLTRHYHKLFLSKDLRLPQFTAPVERLFDIAGTNKIFASGAYAGQKISYCLSVPQYEVYLDRTFQQTMGIFKFRAVNSFNPFYWFGLPGRTLKSFNICLQNPINAIISALVWVVSVVLAYKLEIALYNGLLEELHAICRNILK